MAKVTQSSVLIKKVKKSGKAKKHPNKHESIKKYVGQGK